MVSGQGHENQRVQSKRNGHLSYLKTVDTAPHVLMLQLLKRYRNLIKVLGLNTIRPNLECTC